MADVNLIMQRQRGLITRKQARGAGVGERRIEYLVRTSTWIRVHAGVFRHAAAPQDLLSGVQAAVLAVDGSVASHRAACALFGIGFTNAVDAELTVPHGAGPPRLQGVKVHRSTQWSARQQGRRRGIDCTGIERTIMDTAGTIGVDAVERLAEESVRRRLTSFGRLARFLAWHGKQGRTGSGNLRAMLLRRAPGAALPLSDFSRRVTQLLARHGLPQPELEYRVLDRDGCFVMQADLAWPERTKIVELDGLAFHFGREDVERDRRKRARARAAGWRIHEVLWSMYVDDPTALAEQIGDFLAS